MQRAEFGINKSRHRHNGTSLIESLLVVAVTAMLLTIGLPSLGAAIDQHRLATKTDELFVAMQLARSEAVLRQTRVVVAAVSPGRWVDGWRVFVDDNGNGKQDSGETTLREFAAAPAGLKITAQFGVGYRGDFVSYNSMGVARRPGNAGLVLGHITLSSAEEVRTLCFSSLALRVKRAADCR